MTTNVGTTTSNQEILKVTGLSASYGEAKVLFDIEVSVKPGQIVACVGRNGAGKTSLLRSISGFLNPTTGSVFANNKNLVGMKPYDIAKFGVRYVPQDKKVFYDLTVRENLELASYATNDHNWDRVLEYFPKLKQHMDRKAGFMSGGERQMLMIGRATLGSPQGSADRRADRGTRAGHRDPSAERLQGTRREDRPVDCRAEPALGLRYRRQGLCDQGRARGR